MRRLTGDVARSVPVRLLAATVAGVALASLAATLAGIEGALRYTDIPVVVVAVPAVEADAAAPPADDSASVEPDLDVPDGPPAVPDEPPVAGAPPVDPLPALLEPGPFGALPRVSAEFGSPFQAYRRPGRLLSGTPAVALVITGLGLQRVPTLAASETPAPVALAFSPYAAGVAGWARFARWRGHETLVELPLQPQSYPRDDAGPLALHPALSPAEWRDRLFRVLAKAPGAFAVAVEAGVYAAQPDAFEPVARELASRGMGLLEIGGAHLQAVARETGLPYATAATVVDDLVSPEALDRAFGELEAASLTDGRAGGVIRPLPLSYARLAQWLPSLPRKGLLLAPPSALFP